MVFNLFKNIKYLFCLEFKINEQVDILLLDDGVTTFTLNKKYKLIDRDKINFFCLIKSFFSFFVNRENLSFKEHYLKLLYRSFKAKIVISHDVNQKAFQCKKICPEIICIVYQFGYLRNEERFENLKVLKKKYKSCDYFFCFHEIDKKVYEKYYKAKFIVVGSVKNNEIVLPNKKKTNYVNYISEFYNNKLDSRYDYHAECEKFIVKVLSKFCKSRKKKLIISLRSNRQDKQHIKKSEEIDYFNKFIGNNFEYSFLNSYEVSNNSEITVCKSSNLGFELISRKIKVFFLPLGDDKKKNKIPYLKNYESPLVSYLRAEELIMKKLDYLIEIDQENWVDILNKNINLIKFDEKNCILKNTISKYLT